jgi:RHS repeat-associated protein
VTAATKYIITTQVQNNSTAPTVVTLQQANAEGKWLTLATDEVYATKDVSIEVTPNFSSPMRLSYSLRKGLATDNITVASVKYIRVDKQASSRLVILCNTDADFSDDYRYGFNGQEKDNEVKGVGNSLDFGARVYDSRLGRFMSVDPFAKNFASQSSYIYAGNSPICYKDNKGMFRFPAGKEEEYKTKYPYFYAFITNKEGVETLLSNSKAIQNELFKNTVGILTSDRVKADSKFGESSPMIVVYDFKDVNIHGQYVNPECDGVPEAMRVSEADIMAYENSCKLGDKAKFGSLYNLMILSGIIIHEYTHKGDYEDGLDAIQKPDGTVINDPTSEPCPPFPGTGKPHAFEEGGATQSAIYGPAADNVTRMIQTYKAKTEGVILDGSLKYMSTDKKLIDQSVIPKVVTPKKVTPKAVPKVVNSKSDNA